MNQVHEILATLCKRAGTPVSQRVSALADEGKWIELQKLKVVPTDYDDPFEYWVDAQCVDLVRKMAIPGSGTAQAAVDTFLETERDCFRVNQRMRRISDNSGLSVSDLPFLCLLDDWKEKIRVVLGKVPEYIEPAFSGGSTTSTSRLTSTIFDKLSMTPQRYSHSTELVDYLFYSSRWGDVAHQRRLYPTVVSANDYFTVPKNGETDRSCCMEAVMNLAYQLGAGKVMRQRALKVLGIDLNQGAGHHRLLARLGSIDGSIATLDLKSASDRWARLLVRFLLPEDWRTLLDSLRATATSFGGKRLYLEKFSSMGNGFTFELETILFATLAHVVAARVGLTGEIYCYGDDLIVEPLLYEPLVNALREAGHVINTQKSFSEGPFRESCGGDFHSGEAVSTAKLEKLPEEPSDWVALANNLRRIAWGRPRHWALIKPVWEAVLRQIPTPVRACRGPVHLGDLVIHDLPRFWSEDNRGYVRVWKPVILKRELQYYADNLTALALGMSRSGELQGRVPLRQVAGYKHRWMDPTAGSTWLPSDPFRRVDRRYTELRDRLADYDLECEIAALEEHLSAQVRVSGT